jgi:pectinesterase
LKRGLAARVSPSRAASFLAGILPLALAAAGFHAPPAAGQPRVLLVGDSTIAPRNGYGDALCGLFKWQVECLNLARNGRSTKSYRADGTWAERVVPVLADRDRARATWVLIQFGHNDQPGKAERSTDLATGFPANLERYLDEVQSAGARPVLVTPLTRRTFDAGGTLKDDLAPWAEATRAVARRRNVPLLDLYAQSVARVAPLGQSGADALAQAPPGQKEFDRTHLGPRGAALFARVVADEIAGALPELASHLVVGAVEPPGRIARPQMTAEQARHYSYASVLGDWDPLADALARGEAFRPDYVVEQGVAAGGAAFASVQAAIDAAVARAWGSGQRERVRILLRPGTYEERVDIPSAAPPITLYGASPDAASSRIRFSLDATRAGNTPASSIVRVRARGFQAKNLTIENSYNKDSGDKANQSQAVALMLDDADEAHLENVRLLGFQDTLYLAATNAARPARAFIHRSYVEGDMDFIFGEATAYFLATEVRSLGDRAVSYALAPSTHLKSPHGLVFEGCRFTHDGSPNALGGFFKLARQWNRSPEHVGKVAILNSAIGAHIDRERPWADWSIGTPRYRPVRYELDGEPLLAEFQNTQE